MSIARHRVTTVALVALLLALLAAAVPPPVAAAPPDPADPLSGIDIDVERALATRAQTAERSRALVGSGDAHAAQEAAGLLPEVAGAQPGSLVVTVESGAEEGVQQAAETSDAAGLADAEVQPLAEQVLQVVVPEGEEEAAAAQLLRRPDVLAVERDAAVSLRAVPDDPAYTEQWSHQLTGIEQAWDTTTGSAAVKVAVIDSGITAEHPDLASVVGEQVAVNPITKEVEPAPVDNETCRIGHGTWVAGVVGAAGNNGIDVAGVNWDVELLDINVFNYCEDGEFVEGADGSIQSFISDVTAGIDYAVTAGAKVLNLSLGAQGRSCPTAMQVSIDNARAAGATVVVASGNTGPETYGWPDACNGAISVAGQGPTGEEATYSSSSRYVDLTAPSGDFLPDRDPEDFSPPTSAEGILTTSWWEFGERTDSTIPVFGTSFSSPYVAGVAALLLSVDPDLTPDEIEGVLESTAVDLGTPGRNAEHGWGQVDPTAAVELVASGAPLPAPEPDPEFPVGTPLGLRPGGPVEVLRISAGTGVTEPIEQAVAFSQDLYVDNAAVWAVLARDDKFADALAGSSLTLGAGPLLFSGSTGSLAEDTAAELQRVLPPGSPVLILGGPAALPAGIDNELLDLGYLPVRLAGEAREDTAAQIARALRGLIGRLGFELDTAILVSREVWYDAITAGSLAAPLPAPVLLTDADRLHPATAAALGTLDPQTLYVVGGQVRVTDATEAQAGAVTGAEVVRLAGPTRDATAVEVAGEIERLMAEDYQRPFYGVTVNLTREDGWTHALSAAPWFGLSFDSVVVPVLGDDGSEYTPVVVDYFQGLASDVVIPGDVDLVSEESAAQLQSILETPGDG